MFKLNKYIQAAKISIENGFVYRLNFIMWRVRVVVQLLAIYFLWLAVLQNRSSVFDYSQSALLTYILGTSIVRSVVFNIYSTDVQTEISTGDLNNQLIKPFNYFVYWFFRDIGGKLLNLVFLVIELGAIFVILQPPMFLQTNTTALISFLAACLLAMVMYFYFSFLISLTTFWMPEHNGWPQRFFIFVVLEFFSGGLFPLDILPQPIFAVVKFLPTAHFLHTPLQIYLGRISGSELLPTLIIMIAWTTVFALFANWVFKQGLKIYGAYGR